MTVLINNQDLIIFSSLPISHIINPNFRYTLGAKEICFTNPVYSWFFRSGRIIPIVRGAGIYQDSMTKAIDILDRGGWIHIFSEGKINQTTEITRFKWGVARLIMESKVPVYIVPIYTSGLHEIQPLQRKSKMPRLWKKAYIRWGDPVDSRKFLDLVGGMDSTNARIVITREVQKMVQGLKV